MFICISVHFFDIKSGMKDRSYTGADLAFFSGGGGGGWPNDDAEHRPRAA